MSNFSFSHNDFTQSYNRIPHCFVYIFDMISLFANELEETEIGISGKGLTLYCWAKAQDMRTGGHLFDIRLSHIFFQRIDDSRCNKIRSCLTAAHVYHDGYVGKQPVDWKK